MPSISVPTLVSVLLGLIIVVYKLVDLVRSPRRPALWCLWSALLTLTLALSARLVENLTSLFGLDVIWVVQHWLLFVSFVALELFFLLSIYSRPTAALRAFRPHGAVLLVAIGVMTTAFSIARNTENPDFTALETYSGPWSTSMLLAYVTWFSAAMFAIARLSWRWSNITDKSWMRIGLRSLAIGAGVSLTYGMHKIVYTVLIVTGQPFPWSQPGIEGLLMLLGITFALVGLILPAVGPQVSAACMWVRHARCYRRLGPLWRELADETRGVTPEVRLTNPAPWWDTTFALQRRVIEIWDGRRRLSRYVDPDVASRALARGHEKGLSGNELAATVEAECLREAIRMKRAGVRPVTAAVRTSRTGNNLASAVAFLERVAAAFTRADQHASTHEDNIPT